jgi:tellurite resistance protein TerC
LILDVISCQSIASASALLAQFGEPLVNVDFRHWVAFILLVTGLLLTDLMFFHKKSKEPTLREAALATGVWVMIALAFNLFLWWAAGPLPATIFFTGYLVEWSLSMDNVFVFAVIFQYFNVPMKYQYRVLFWGILGAVVMRLSFILVGKVILDRFAWVTYILGAFLVYTAYKLATSSEEADPEKGWALRISRKLLPVAKENSGEKFFVREAGRLMITPLFLVLIVIQTTDIAFSMDSVPAIFGFTDDPFIIFSSNVFAILGLRALYFLLAGVMGMFRYLNYGLSAILAFVGLKMLTHWLHEPPKWYVDRFGMPAQWVKDWIGNPPAWLSLLIVMSLLTIAIVASLVHNRIDGGHEDGHSKPAAELPPDEVPSGAHKEI